MGAEIFYLIYGLGSDPVYVADKHLRPLNTALTAAVAASDELNE